MSIDLGRRLIASGIVPPAEVEAAVFLSIVRGLPFARVLLDRGAVTERALEEELERVGGLGLRQVAGSPELIARLPRAMCRRLAALPTRVDVATGTIEVIAADPLDVHVAAEFGFHLGAPIRVVRAPIAAIEEEIRRLELDDQDLPAVERPRPRRATPAFPHGAPQSSNPPPPPEETPIPLMRRIAAPPLPARMDDAASKDRVSPARPPQPLQRPPMLRARKGELPSVSFPSEPPVSGAPLRLSAPGARGHTPAPTLVSMANPSVAAYAPQPRAPAVGAAATEEPAPRTLRPRLLAEMTQPPANRSTSVPPDEGASAASAEATPVGEPESVSVHVPVEAAPTPPPMVAPPAVAPDAVEHVPRKALRPQAAVRAAQKRLHDPDAVEVFASLLNAASRDEVVTLAIRGLQLIAERAAVFVVRRDGFRGWACGPTFGDEAALREVLIAPDEPSIFATAAITGIYLGPIPPTPAHEALLRVCRHRPTEMAALVVRVSGRSAMVLLADELEDTMIATRFMDELGRAVGAALGRLLSSGASATKG